MPPARQQPLKPPIQLQQLNLPLTRPEIGLSISAQEVWPTLNPQQQDYLFRRMVQLCCSLLTTGHPKEVPDDQH